MHGLIQHLVTSREGGTAAAHVPKAFEKQWEEGVIDLKKLLLEPAKVLEDKDDKKNETTATKDTTPKDTATLNRLGHLETNISNIAAAVQSLTNVVQQQARQGGGGSQSFRTAEPAYRAGKGGRGGRGRGW